MKEALHSPYPKLVFSETFRDEQAVRKNGGTPTDVSFSNGVGTFNGTSSKANYNLGLNGTYSVRIRCNPTSFAVAQVLFDVRGTNNDGSGYLFTTATTGIASTSSGLVYTKGVIGTNVTLGITNEIVVTGISLAQGTGINKILIGLRFNNMEGCLGTIDLFEIYSGTLTPSEVSNLYNNSWNTELSGMGGEPKSNLITNSDFDSSSSWGTTGTFSISNGKLNCISNGSYYIAFQNSVMVIGKKYRIIVNCNEWTSGSVRVGNSGDITAIVTSTGIFTFDRIAASSTLYIERTGICDLKLDSITLQELNPKTLIDFNSTNGVIEDSTVGDTVGSDLVSGWDFTNWSPNNGTLCTINNSTTFTTSAGAGIYKSLGLIVGKKYRLSIKATTTSSSFIIKNGAGTVNYLTYPQLISEFTATNDNTLYIRNEGAGITIITELIVYEIRPDLSATAVTVNKNGALFNGTTSLIDTKTDMIGTSACTVMGWIKPYSYGETSNGIILVNGKFDFGVSGAGNKDLQFTSNGFVSVVYSAINSIVLNKYQFVSITRTSAGVTNFYVGDLNTAPTLNGSADQASGTPAAGTTNVIIGNNSGASRTFDGLIPKLKVIEGILTLAEITQEWSSTLNKIK